jgi:hypothetical protein
MVPLLRWLEGFRVEEFGVFVSLKNGVVLESIYVQSTYQILFHANIMQLTCIKEGKCTFLDQIEENAFIFLITG